MRIRIKIETLTLHDHYLPRFSHHPAYYENWNDRSYLQSAISELLITYRIFLSSYGLLLVLHFSSFALVLPYQVSLTTTAKLFSCLDAARDERRLFYPLLVPEDLKQR